MLNVGVYFSSAIHKYSEPGENSSDIGSCKSLGSFEFSIIMAAILVIMTLHIFDFFHPRLKDEAVLFGSFICYVNNLVESILSLQAHSKS